MLLERLAGALVLIAAICLVAMVGLIVADVTLGNLLGARIFGAYEIVALLMAPVAFLPIARTLLKDGQITVEIVDALLPGRAIQLLRVFGLAGMLVFAAMLAIFMYTPMMDTVRYGEFTPDREIPMIVKLGPIFIALCVAALCAAFLLVRETLKLLRWKGERA
ncbi:TRAP transporter small permease subunit [Oricola sp.]|uniref:TRAP transporter small permease n=1 Tax=Oricola sp. TaxID=1979950 RepID=UPI0025F1EDED|nr:TRAP transporter small permease subunit [Oricola sp.]MCI5077987.1 TRAP transporter small permease [Oricola sp.]